MDLPPDHTVAGKRKRGRGQIWRPVRTFLASPFGLTFTAQKATRRHLTMTSEPKSSAKVGRPLLGWPMVDAR